MVEIDAKNIFKHEASYDLVRKMRASVLLYLDLSLQEWEEQGFPPGGGCIGARPVDLHLKGLELLGAEM